MSEWEGSAAIQAALKDAANVFPPSGSKIKVVVNECIKRHKEFKFVVYEIERFIRKANKSEHRVVGLYCFDALCRKSGEKGGAKDPIVKRAGDKLSGILGFMDRKKTIEAGPLSKICAGFIERKQFPDNILLNCKEYILPEQQQDNNDLPPAKKPRSSRFTDVSAGDDDITPSSSSILAPPMAPVVAASSGAARSDPRKRARKKIEDEDNNNAPEAAQLEAEIELLSPKNESKANKLSAAYERLIRNTKNIQGRKMNTSSTTNYLTTAMMDTIILQQKAKNDGDNNKNVSKEPQNFLIYPPHEGLMEIRTLAPAEALKYITPSN